MVKTNERLVVTRKAGEKSVIATLTVNGEEFQDVNPLTVIEQVFEKYQGLRGKEIEVNDEVGSHYINTVWGYLHSGYDIIHVDMTAMDTPNVEVLLEDIVVGMTEDELENLLENIVRYTKATTVEEAIEYGKKQVRRDYITLVTLV